MANGSKQKAFTNGWFSYGIGYLDDEDYPSLSNQEIINRGGDNATRGRSSLQPGVSRRHRGASRNSVRMWVWSLCKPGQMPIDGDDCRRALASFQSAARRPHLEKFPSATGKTSIGMSKPIRTVDMRQYPSGTGA
jgi:hypothetical protein